MLSGWLELWKLVRPKFKERSKLDKGTPPRFGLVLTCYWVFSNLGGLSPKATF